MVDSSLRRPRRPSGGTVIATVKNRKTARSAKRRAAPVARRRSAPRAAKRRRGPLPADLQPLGVGVADAFALDRLAVPARRRRAPKRAVRELGWAAFGDVARVLAGKIALRYRPTVVVGVAKGGIFVGGAISAALGADFYPVRIEKRRRDASPQPGDVVSELPDLHGKKVLVVDDVASTGATLARARALSRKAGAKEVRTAVLVARPRGARPDFAALETDELVLFGWDYELAGGGGALDPGEVGV
jgi:hypoxanthine phosphoribosyltransferase